MKNLNLSQLKHIEILKQKVFEVNIYPSFNILINELPIILDSFDKKGKNIAILERTKLYETSLFGGLFQQSNVISFDCSPESAKERGAYNQDMVDHEGFINFQKIEFIDQSTSFQLPKDKFDLVFIPNLVHHFKHQKILYDQCYESLKSKGSIIIFEPTFREIHQAPNDYIRYTPYGMEQVLKESKFHSFKCKEYGDAYDALVYILNIMNSKRNDEVFEQWFKDMKSSIQKIEKQKIDIVKKNARFTTSFIAHSKK